MEIALGAALGVAVGGGFVAALGDLYHWLKRSQVNAEELKTEKLKEFGNYIKTQEMFLKSFPNRLQISPESMWNLLEEKTSSLKDDFLKQLGTENGEKTPELKKLEELLKREQLKFYKTYQSTFLGAMEELKRKKEEELNEYIKEKERDTEGFFATIMTTPSSMKELVEQKVNELVADFDRRVDGNGEKKAQLMQQLKESFQSDINSFCDEYGKKYRFNMKILILVGTGSAVFLPGSIALGLFSGYTCAKFLSCFIVFERVTEFVVRNLPKLIAFVKIIDNSLQNIESITNSLRSITSVVKKSA